MNHLIPNKIKTGLARGTASALIVLAAALTVSAVMAQSPSKQQQKGNPKAQWPEEKDKDKVIKAFTDVLTQSAADGQTAFREQITKSTGAAKNAVQEKLDKDNGTGSIVIPSQVFVMFYEPENPSAPQATGEKGLAPSNQDNQHYHVFYLPQADGKEHLYKDHLVCCYPVWHP